MEGGLKLLIKQFSHKETSTYSYLIASNFNNAILIDPVKDEIERYKKKLEDEHIRYSMFAFSIVSSRACNTNKTRTRIVCGKIFERPKVFFEIFSRVPSQDPGKITFFCFIKL